MSDQDFESSVRIAVEQNKLIQSIMDGTYRPTQSFDNSKNQHVNVFDIDPGVIPSPHITITQLSLSKLADVISRCLEPAIFPFKGVAMNIRTNGQIDCAIVFDPEESKTKKESQRYAIEQNPKYAGESNDYITSMLRAKNNMGTHKYILTKYGEKFFNKYLINDGRRINYEQYMSERKVREYNVERTYVVLHSINLDAIVNDIWIPVQVQESERKYFIQEWKNEYYERDSNGNWVYTDETKTVHKRKREQDRNGNIITGKETDNIILSKSGCFSRFSALIRYKGYRYMNGSQPQFYPGTPAQGTANQSLYTTDNFYVNIEVMDTQQMRADLPELLGSTSETAQNFLNRIAL